MNSSISGSRNSARYLAGALGTLVLLTAAVITFVQWALPHYRLLERISPMRFQVQRAQDAAERVEALAIGDSHAGLGLYPDSPNVMNAAFAGESVREMRAKLRYLLPRLPRLRTVLLQSQPSMLAAYRDRPVSDPYLKLSGSGSFHPFERWLAQFDPCCRALVLREALLAVAGRASKHPGPDVLQNGYLDYTPYANYDRSRFGALAAAEVASYGEPVFVEALASEYEALVDELAAAGIRVVLVSLPLSQSYWNAMGQARMQQADEFFRRVAERRGLTRCGSWLAQADESYFNPDHLTVAAAKAYWPAVGRCALGGPS